MINTNPRNELNMKIKRRVIPTLEVGEERHDQGKKWWLLVACGGGTKVVTTALVVASSSRPQARRNRERLPRWREAA